MIVLNKYKLLDKIGEGSYGSVHIGEHIYFKKKVAIKINKESDNILLKNEAKIYKYLENTNGVPNMLLYGLDNGYYFIILDKLDKQLERNNEQNIYNIGIIMIEIIEAIHKKGVIHRDIKPDNFMFKNNKLYLLDYGLATMYLDSDLKHKKQETISNIIGSPNYISTNIHNYILPSRRDDIESIIYVLLYLHNKLELENLTETEIRKFKQQIFYKYSVKTNETDLILKTLIKMLIYVRNLSYFDRPDYKYLYKLLKD